MLWSSYTCLPCLCILLYQFLCILCSTILLLLCSLFLILLSCVLYSGLHCIICCLSSFVSTIWSVIHWLLACFCFLGNVFSTDSMSMVLHSSQDDVHPSCCSISNWFLTLRVYCTLIMLFLCNWLVKVDLWIWLIEFSKFQLFVAHNWYMITSTVCTKITFHLLDWVSEPSIDSYIVYLISDVPRGL